MGFYIEQSDRSRKSGLAAEDIPLGALVVHDDTGVRLATATDGQFDGVADNPNSSDWIAPDDDTDIAWEYSATENEYNPSGADRVVYGGDEDRALIKALVADPANVDHNAVVGIGATSGKVVVQTDETDFLEVGKVYKDDATEVDEPVRIEVRQ